MKVHIIRLGCSKNQIDAEVMAGLLLEAGFTIVPPEEAEICIVNTCAFILPAKEEAIDEILTAAALKEQGLRYLVVTGCLPQRYPQELEKELPEVDLFLGTAEVPRIAEHLQALIEKTSDRRSVVTKPTFLMDAGHPRLLEGRPATAYLKIAEGCSNRCTYCVIPSIRGSLRSRLKQDILQEAAALADTGIKEIILTAQDTTAYGRDRKEKSGLAGLLSDLAAIDKIRWIRLLYAHPATLKPDVLTAMAGSDKICAYIDLPIQHIDDTILNAMNRHVDSARIKALIEQARRAIPGLALRTSLIVGFPGETKRRFERLLDFVRETRFDHLGVFTYSREKGTKAAALRSQVTRHVKEERREFIMAEQAPISRAINEGLVGSRTEVLIEGKSGRKDFPFLGRARRQAPEVDGATYVRKGRPGTGDILNCRIVAADDYDLFAEVVP
ncbi:MAG: 30S ribosomal protein S12 methylthiotransferase RimO [Smithellaceae bacterium]|nr:30S ribosomal protein S12 methylthiotransferase RimO [Smithellaceae bacterium]